MKCWKTSVTELMGIFKGALCALLPWFVHAKIPFTSQESYDDFDEISTVLFRRIVTDSLAESLAGIDEIPNYGVAISDYQNHSFILVKRSGRGAERLAFIALEFDKNHTPKIKVAALRADLAVIGIEIIDYDGLSFALARNQKEGIDEICDVKVEI